MQSVTDEARLAFDTSPIKRKYKCFIDWITKGDTPGAVTAGEWDSTYFAKENVVNDETYARFKPFILSDSMRLGDKVRLVSNKYENGWLGANRSDSSGEFIDVEIVDSYDVDYCEATSFLYFGDDIKAAQSFTGKSAKLKNCKWYAKKYGNPTGDIIAKLYAHSGTYGVSSIPTGEPLATSNPIDITTLTEFFKLITFSFEGAEQYELVEGTYYCISIEYSGGDSSNHLKLGRSISSPTHSGNRAFYNDSWYFMPTHDFIFYVYAYSLGTAEVISEIYTSTIQTTHLTVFGSPYNYPINMDLYYRNSTNTDWILCNSYIGLTSYITVYKFPTLTTIKGWKVEISKINLADMLACIVEVMAGFREGVSADLTAKPMDISKELEYSGASLSIGNISANTLRLRLVNTSQKYNPENVDSYLYPYLKYNKIIYPSIGIDLGDSIEWFAQGKYYLKEITPNPDMTVEFYAVDKMILMNGEDFESSLVYEDNTKSDLIELLVSDFGLDPLTDCDIEETFDVIPYAYFEPRKYAENIKRLEIADGGVAFFDELGKFNSKTRGWTESGVAAYYDDSNIKKDSASSPVISSSMKNYIRIKSNPLYEQVQQEVYSLTQNITIPANGTRDVACYFNKKPCRVVNIADATYAPMGVGITITDEDKYSFVTFLTFENSTGADVDVTSISILAQPLEATGTNEVISQDADLIFIYGKSEYLIDSEFIQDMDYAQELADDLLTDYKDPEALEIEIEAPSRPYLQLGDTVNVKMNKLNIGG